MGTSETLRTRLLSSQQSFKKYIFYDLKIFFLQNEYNLRKIYILFVTQTFSAEKYISQMRHIYFYIFIYIFFCKKVFFQ